MKLKQSSSTRVNKKIEREPPCIVKKQRSKRHLQVRSQISPILLSTNLSLNKNKGVSVDSISCSHFGDEVSSDSSRVTVESSLIKKRKFEDSPFRRITRSYYKNKEKERTSVEVEVGESSCVEDSKNSSSKGIQVNYTSTFSSLHQNLNSRKTSSEIKEDDALSVASGVESCLSRKTTTNREKDLSEISRDDAVSVNECVLEKQKKPNSLGGGGGESDDLACTEELHVDDGVSDYSSCQETLFSELQSEIFREKYSSDDLDFSDDYTPSIFFESGSDFSEKSVSDSNPSQTYSLLLQFRQQFSRSSLPLETTKSSSLLEAEHQENFAFARLDDEEDEESYKRLRERERRQLFLHDYPELYRTTTEFGDLILQQRLQMVHWIIEQSTAKEFDLATVFLGISLLDRFLAIGFFKNKSHLQIVGIACLSLATRIEENQPYNCVRQKNFNIGNNVYSRSEVVAMEWLVQEVLNFQCFLPTIHNFMWFYLKAMKAGALVEKRARYLAVLALSDLEQLRHWPSTVAATLVILASLESNEIASYGRVIEVHVRTNENDLHQCIKSLEWLLQYMS
ncbi:PREDICTED: cyclin-SDS [Populus euphratica]|uniref:B-like cyclin n=1 Tax=Populus euphratica TaxID=75702 RepID=A0AAJ6U2S2_POPEU|nr:PREDICTED: cyclin-SDS [Populus euphratica]